MWMLSVMKCLDSTNLDAFLLGSGQLKKWKVLNTIQNTKIVLKYKPSSI